MFALVYSFVQYQQIIGYLAKTPFSPLKDAVLTEKKYLKKVPGESASIPAKNTGYEVTFDIKTRMTNEQSQSFAHTVGVNASGGIKDVFEIGASYEFQSTFGTSISLREEQTVSRKFSLTNELDRTITATLYQVLAEYTLKPGSVAAGIVNKTVQSPFAQFWQGGHYWDTSTKVKVSSTSTGATKTDDLKLIRLDVLKNKIDPAGFPTSSFEINKAHKKQSCSLCVLLCFFETSIFL